MHPPPTEAWFQQDLKRGHPNTELSCVRPEPKSCSVRKEAWLFCKKQFRCPPIGSSENLKDLNDTASVGCMHGGCVGSNKCLSQMTPQGYLAHKNRSPLGPYNSPMPMVLQWS